ncbi:MAG: hypothetical protein K6G49_01990 [Candidatus Saccharibacteria bacterium]|nr:hypothetical protein [Candidatus Saccharibacteria bacterium]
MVRKSKFYLTVDKELLTRFSDDHGLFYWYLILQDYSERFKKDKLGFIRVPSKVFSDDHKIDRKKIWRYNKKLEDKGLIKVDRVHRGGHTWIGYKFI